jgi:hypothetical protein
VSALSHPQLYSCDRMLAPSNTNTHAFMLERCRFGKRGTSCIGFMVVGRGDTPDEYKVMFYHIFTNDGCQDEESVAGMPKLLWCMVGF